MTAIFLSAKSLYHACNAPKRNLLLPKLLQPRLIFSSAKPLCHTDRQEKCKRLHILLQHDGIFVGKRVVSCIRNDEKRNALLPTLLKTNCNLYRQNPLPLRIGAERRKRLSSDYAKFGITLRRCRLIDAPIIFWHIAAEPKDRFCRKTAERCAT